MDIQALGYIGVNSTRLADWGSFATGLLGMQEVDRGGLTRAFRMDDRRQRLIVTGEEGEDLGFLGWEMADAAALAALAARLEAHGVAVEPGTRALADQRHVAALIRFADPAGNRLEAFHGPALASDPFVPGRPISGFRTGPLGMGHAVMHVADVSCRKGAWPTPSGVTPTTTSPRSTTSRPRTFSSSMAGTAGSSTPRLGRRARRMTGQASGT